MSCTHCKIKFYVRLLVVAACTCLFCFFSYKSYHESKTTTTSLSNEKSTVNAEVEFKNSSDNSGLNFYFRITSSEEYLSNQLKTSVYFIRDGNKWSKAEETENGAFKTLSNSQHGNVFPFVSRKYYIFTDIIPENQQDKPFSFNSMETTRIKHSLYLVKAESSPEIPTLDSVSPRLNPYGDEQLPVYEITLRTPLVLRILYLSVLIAILLSLISIVTTGVDKLNLVGTFIAILGFSISEYTGQIDSYVKTCFILGVMTLVISFTSSHIIIHFLDCDANRRVE